MSLEQAITDHASALRELAAAIRATIGAHDTTAAAAHQVISDAKKPAENTTKADAPGPARAAINQALEAARAGTKKLAPDAGDVAAAAAADSAPAPTYDDVKAKVLALSKDKGREPTVQLLQRHGVEKAPDLKPAQYAAFIADVDAIMAGTYDPEAAEIA